jgi:hypothetical protein
MTTYSQTLLGIKPTEKYIMYCTWMNEMTMGGYEMTMKIKAE